MKPMKLLEVIKLLEDNGFKLLRSNGHVIYGNGEARVALSHQRVVSVGVMRNVMKAIRLAKSGSEVKVHA